MFLWSKSSFNVTDLHIDSISICKSARPRNEHSLDNVLVLTVSCCEQGEGEGALQALARACAARTKRLVNTLNEVGGGGGGGSAEAVLGGGGERWASGAQIDEFLASRPVYATQLDAEQLRAYENEWCRIR